MCETCPYPDDIALLDDYFIWLRCRARRVAEERDPLPLVFPLKGATKATATPDEDWPGQEKAAWAVLQDRLEAHRADPEAPTLGLKLLRTEHELDANEVLILVACTAVAISQHLANEILGDDFGGFGIQVEDAWALMRPCCKPWGLEDLLAFRRYFRPGGRLVDAGLISVEIKEGALPAELSGAWVQLTDMGFKAITGYAP